MLPSISVVVLNYEYHMFLDQCLASVMEQRRSPAEIIVMDDASPSGIEVVKKIVEPMMRVAHDCGIDLSLHVQDENLGTPGNMRSGLDLARADYVMMLGADNFLDPWYLSETAKILDDRPEVGVVYTDVIAFGPLAEERSRNSTWWRNKKVRWSKEGVQFTDTRARARHYGATPEGFIWEFLHFDDQVVLRNALAQRNFIHGSSLFRRSILGQAVPGTRFEAVEGSGGVSAGCFSAEAIKGWGLGARVRDMPRAEDWDFWKQIVIDRGWEAEHVQTPLLHYRQHSNQQRNVPKK